jgi:hypothetical protein
MGIDADEQGPGDAGAVPLLADRLADGQNMRLVEGIVDRGTSTSIDGGAVLPASGLTSAAISFSVRVQIGSGLRSIADNFVSGARPNYPRIIQERS